MKKSKQVKKNKLSKLFRVSKPYGYHMPDVNKAIFKYNEVVDQLKESVTNRDKTIRRQRSEIEEYKEELSNVKNELHNMQLEMNMLELPNMHELQEQVVIDRFKKNRGQDDSSRSEEREQEKKEEEEKEKEEYSDEQPDLDIPIVGNDEVEETVDLNKDKNIDFEIVE